ncbi:cilia- and flagella-associated protein 52 isoform X3 [Cuculus canorus]|uniref:cilia- and flagella-associated protein 52 isoform X3 n=1 Tax=Cuculus canorus TaxID=55661 RepID=UPI0023AA4686|nr:cilia- and flagella-associated protein 52 isoform X3 [Cuculus canorus]
MAAATVGDIELLAAIGYNGHICSGLCCHPDEKHILYPLGCAVVVQELGSQKQTFLRGHMNNVSCLSVSRDGQYVASGEAALMNCKADIILWDFQQKKLLARLSLHKGRIEALSFSPSSLYLVSLGGQDDGRVVVWHVSKQETFCLSPASARNAGNATVVMGSSCRDEIFVTAGNGTMRVWELDSVNRKIHLTECWTGRLRRVFTCVKIADDDSYFYVGTTSGDILQVNTNTKVMTSYGPEKKTFSSGVTALLLLTTGDLIVGTGEGIVALLKTSNYRVMKKISIQGAVTSLTCGHQDRQFFVGTNECQIYRINVDEFKEELITTCHNEAVQDIVFPLGISDLFATCSKNDIRVWHTPEHKELLRIVVHNSTCHAIDILSDGNSIISAWDDGIRSFTARSGRLMYMINDAHRLGVTAIAATSDGKRIISGGGEGQDGDSTTSLGSLCWCLRSLSVKKFFPISSLNLAWHNLRPFPLIAYHLGEETNTHLTKTSFLGAAESDEISPQPPLLQTKQPQVPQLLLLRFVMLF